MVSAGCWRSPARHPSFDYHAQRLVAALFDGLQARLDGALGLQVQRAGALEAGLIARALHRGQRIGTGRPQFQQFEEGEPRGYDAPRSTSVLPRRATWAAMSRTTTCALVLWYWSEITVAEP